MFSALIIFIFAISHSLATDYCNKELCRNGGHIACNNNGKFSPKCGQGAEVINLSNFKDLIVSEHNKFRNIIALGKQNPYKTASRMATMTWDEELAKLAVLNVKQCEMKHDKCHNTPAFKFSGQNLAWWKGSSDKGVKERLISAIQNWYDEYKNADNSVIQKYRSSSGKPYGHFTVMVAERCYRVGCASVRVKSKGSTEYFIACNYAYTNMLNQPIYGFGPATSKCKTGKNTKYPGLCSVNEKY